MSTLFTYTPLQGDTAPQYPIYQGDPKADAIQWPSNPLTNIDAKHFVQMMSEVIAHQQYLSAGLGPLFVKNATGSDINIGQLVYPSGVDGDGNILIDLADSAYVLRPALYVVNDILANGSTGLVYPYKTIANLDTSGHSVGDAVYLGTTGNYTYIDTGTQIVGRVVTVDASTGSIWFFPGFKFSQFNPGLYLLRSGADTGAISQAQKFQNGVWSDEIRDYGGTLSLINLSSGSMLDPYNVAALNWHSRLMYDGTSTAVINWNDSNLISNFGISLDWYNCQLKSSNGAVLDWVNYFIYDSLGHLSIRFDSRTLLESDGDTVLNWENQELFDNGGSISTNWSQRTLSDGSQIALNWQNRVAIDSAGATAIDWDGRYLWDGSSHWSADWGNRLLADSSAQPSVDWTNRRLKDSSGNIILDWSSAQKLPKQLFDHYADVSNGTTVETDLYSDTLAASQLGSNGTKIIAKYGGVFAGAASSTQQIRAYFGGSVIFDSGAISIGATTPSWDLQLTIIRESSTVVRVTASYTSASTVYPVSAQYYRITGLTLSNTQILKITGQAAGASGASNQITAKLGNVKFEPAA